MTEGFVGPSDSVGPIVIEWANRTVGGNPAYVEVKNFINYLTGTVVVQKDFSVGEKSIGIAWLERHGFL